MTQHLRTSRFLASVLTLALTIGLPFAGACAQESFPTPEAAAKALVDAVRGHEKFTLDRFFGEGARDVLSTGNPDEDQRNIDKFIAAADEAVQLDKVDEDTRVLKLGRAQWPFPVPIAKLATGWTFDLAAGREEILNRTIGRNELSAIEACRLYVEAQKEYYRIASQDDGVPQYAQRIISSPGKRDGLYWPASNQADRSPLGDGILEDVLRAVVPGKPTPYHGYYFRILTGQGPSALGGAYNYVINGRMIAGFGLVAYPEDWGRTGVMSFICNQQGRIFEKNLGPRSTTLGAAMSRFDPDKTWRLVAD
jgi:hypothetical protein